MEGKDSVRHGECLETLAKWELNFQDLYSKKLLDQFNNESRLI